MNPVKEAVIRLVRSLPDDCTIEDIHYHLYIREKVETGLRDRRGQGCVGGRGRPEDRGMAKLVWTEPALADVRDIIAYIRRDSPVYARKIGQQLRQAPKVLKAAPRLAGTGI